MNTHTCQNPNCNMEYSMKLSHCPYCGVSKSLTREKIEKFREPVSFDKIVSKRLVLSRKEFSIFKSLIPFFIIIVIIASFIRFGSSKYSDYGFGYVIGGAIGFAIPICLIIAVIMSLYKKAFKKTEEKENEISDQLSFFYSDAFRKEQSLSDSLIDQYLSDMDYCRKCYGLISYHYDKNIKNGNGLFGMKDEDNVISDIKRYKCLYIISYIRLLIRCNMIDKNYSNLKCKEDVANVIAVLIDYKKFSAEKYLINRFDDSRVDDILKGIPLFKNNRKHNQIRWKYIIRYVKLYKEKI